MYAFHRWASSCTYSIRRSIFVLSSHPTSLVIAVCQEPFKSLESYNPTISDDIRLAVDGVVYTIKWTTCMLLRQISIVSLR